MNARFRKKMEKAVQATRKSLSEMGMILVPGDNQICRIAYERGVHDALEATAKRTVVIARRYKRAGLRYKTQTMANYARAQADALVMLADELRSLAGKRSTQGRRG